MSDNKTIHELQDWAKRYVDAWQDQMTNWLADPKLTEMMETYFANTPLPPHMMNMGQFTQGSEAASKEAPKTDAPEAEKKAQESAAHQSFTNYAILQRLDAIEKRLSMLEQHLEQNQR